MVTSEYLDRSLQIVDTTLRDGEQTPGVAFSVEEKKLIARKLAAMGIAEIEAGTPATGENEIQVIREIIEMRLPCRVTAWCRATQHDIDLARACGVTSIHISLPVSEIHIQALDKSKPWVLARFTDLISKAREKFEYLSIGLQDASRADLSFLIKCVKLAQSFGAHRVRLADTVGIWEPLQTYETISRIRRHASNIQIGFHGHNDLGMATANTLAAVRAGANSVDVTVNGLGERAGNASLDEVVMACHVALGIDTGIDTQQFVDLAILMENASGRPLPVNKPVTGRSVFLHESGIHVHAMLKDSSTYEPFTPQDVGQSASEFVLGKHSGRAALRHILLQQGLLADERQEKTLLDLIYRAAIRKKESFSNNCIRELHSMIA